MSHLVPAIEEWSFTSNKFCITPSDISKAFPQEKESDILEALTYMNKNGGILLKIHLHAPLSDYKPEERSSLDPLVLKRKFPKIDEVERSGERLGIQIGPDSELIVLHPLSWRSDELMREVMKMKRIKKFLNRDDFCEFVEQHWKIERNQLDIVLRFLKLQTEIRIDESRHQLDDVESTIQRVEKEIVSVPKAAYHEKRGSVSSEVDRLSTKLRFFKLWLGDQDPSSKDSLDYEKLRNSGFLM